MISASRLKISFKNDRFVLKEFTFYLKVSYRFFIIGLMLLNLLSSLIVDVTLAINLYNKSTATGSFNSFLIGTIKIREFRIYLRILA